MQVTLVSKTGGSGQFQGKTIEDMIVYIARVSSSRKDKFDKPDGLLKYCIDNKHWSVFEQGSITFEIKTSKAIGIQLLRHRSFTFQEFSQRYSEVTNFEDVEFRKQADKNRQSSTTELFSIFAPPTCSRDLVYQTSDSAYDDLAEKTVEHLNNTLDLYTEMIHRGVAKECARFILPMCSETTIFMTGTVRSWIHFLDVRDDAHAQLEVQLIAREIKKQLILELPIISKALNWN